MGCRKTLLFQGFSNIYLHEYTNEHKTNLPHLGDNAVRTLFFFLSAIKKAFQKKTVTAILVTLSF